MNTKSHLEASEQNGWTSHGSPTSCICPAASTSKPAQRTPSRLVAGFLFYGSGSAGLPAPATEAHPVVDENQSAANLHRKENVLKVWAQVGKRRGMLRRLPRQLTRRKHDSRIGKFHLDRNSNVHICIYVHPRLGLTTRTGSQTPRRGAGG